MQLAEPKAQNGNHYRVTRNANYTVMSTAVIQDSQQPQQLPPPTWIHGSARNPQGCEMISVWLRFKLTWISWAQFWGKTKTGRITFLRDVLRTRSKIKNTKCWPRRTHYNHLRFKSSDKLPEHIPSGRIFHPLKKNSRWWSEYWIQHCESDLPKVYDQDLTHGMLVSNKCMLTSYEPSELGYLFSTLLRLL